jgi:hypothetical protein
MFLHVPFAMSSEPAQINALPNLRKFESAFSVLNTRSPKFEEILTSYAGSLEPAYACLAFYYSHHFKLYIILILHIYSF